MEEVSILSKRIGDKAWNDFKNKLWDKACEFNKGLPSPFTGYINKVYNELKNNKALELNIRQAAIFQFMDDVEEMKDRVEDLEYYTGNM